MSFQVRQYFRVKYGRVKYGFKQLLYLQCTRTNDDGDRGAFWYVNPNREKICLLCYIRLLRCLLKNAFNNNSSLSSRLSEMFFRRHPYRMVCKTPSDSLTYRFYYPKRPAVRRLTARKHISWQAYNYSCSCWHVRISTYTKFYIPCTYIEKLCGFVEVYFFGFYYCSIYQCTYVFEFSLLSHGLHLLVLLLKHILKQVLNQSHD